MGEHFRGDQEPEQEQPNYTAETLLADLEEKGSLMVVLYGESTLLRLSEEEGKVRCAFPDHEDTLSAEVVASKITKVTDVE